MAKRICSAILVLVLLLLCGIAMISPPKNLYVYSNTDEDIVKTFSPEDADEFNSCEYKDGMIKPTDVDSNIVFNDIDTEFKSVKINVEPKDVPVAVQIFTDKGEGFNGTDTAYAHILSGTDSISLNIDGANVELLRIDVDDDYVLKSVELHSNSAGRTAYKPRVSVIKYILVIVLAFIMTAVFFLLDKKFGLTEKAVEFLKEKKKNILIGAATLAAGLGAAALFETAFALLKDGFKPYRFVLLCAIALIIALFWLNRKNISRALENLTFGIILILGITFAIIRPFGHVAWDFESHYRWALCSSYGGTVFITEADRKCVNAHPDSFISVTVEENNAKIETMNNSGEILSSIERGAPRITHLSMGVPMALARFFGASFNTQVLAGRIGNVLLYAVLCYFAIRKLKSGKVLISIIALFPTNLFLAASFSYDIWVTGFVFLGMAYFISELQEPSRLMKTENTVIMCIAFAMACIPKAIYAPLLLLPFLMNKEKFASKKKYYGICIAAFVVLAAFLAFKSLGIVAGPGDTRGGAVNPAEQIKFILSSPLNYAKILLNFLSRDYLAPSRADQYMLHFAYMGVGTGRELMLISIAMAFLTDKEKDVVTDYKWYIKGALICLFLGMCAIIATSMYVAFTPVKYDVINGCQPRYMIPLLFPLLSVLGIKGISLNTNKRVYNYLMITPVILINLYNIAVMFLPRV